jgi:hypothetical protein
MGDRAIFCQLTFPKPSRFFHPTLPCETIFLLNATRLRTFPIRKIGMRGQVSGTVMFNSTLR